MKATEITFPVYADAHGEHWRPADHTEQGQAWLRCVETDRGTRYLPSVEKEFGPLNAVIDLTTEPHPGDRPAIGISGCDPWVEFDQGEPPASRPSTPTGEPA